MKSSSALVYSPVVCKQGNSGHCIAKREKVNLMSGSPKKLRFFNLVQVTLIPSITEYHQAGLHVLLWCSRDELKEYRDSAYSETKEFMRMYNCNDFTYAMKMLLQMPENTIDAQSESQSEG